MVGESSFPIARWLHFREPITEATSKSPTDLSSGMLSMCITGKQSSVAAVMSSPVSRGRTCSTFCKDVEQVLPRDTGDDMTAATDDCFPVMHIDSIPDDKSVGDLLVASVIGSLK